MPNFEKSNFFALDDVVREKLLTKYERYGVRKWQQNQVFLDVAVNSWWIPSEGFHFVPELLEASILAEQFQALEVDAHGLAEAIYPARLQHDRVIDPCLVFLDSHVGTMIILFLHQHRLPSLARLKEAEVIKISQDFVAGNLTGGAADWLPDELTDHLNSEFSKWLEDFILQLLRWKAPARSYSTDKPADGGTPPTGAEGAPSPS